VISADLKWLRKAESTPETPTVSAVNRRVVGSSPTRGVKRGPGNGAFVVSGVKSPFGLHALLHASEPRTALGRLGKLRGFPTPCGGRPNELPLHRTPTRAQSLKLDGKRGRRARGSTTGARCSPRSASSASRASLRRSTRACIGPTIAGWVKIKNPNYWRRDAEREATVRSRERRARTRF
jgi:hypothetical protein